MDDTATILRDLERIQAEMNEHIRELRVLTARLEEQATPIETPFVCVVDESGGVADVPSHGEREYHA